MNQDLFIKEESKTLPGRIRLNLAEIITGKKNTLPKGNQSLKFFNSIEHFPSYWLFFIHSIITLKSVKKVDFSEILKYASGKKVDINEKLFDQLYERLTLRESVIYINSVPSPLPNELCLWIIKDEYEQQTDKEIVLILTSEFSPSKVNAILIFKKDINTNELIITFFQSNEESEIIVEDKTEKETKEFIFLMLFYAANNRINVVEKMEHHVNDSDNISSSNDVPYDTYLISLLHKVKNGKVSCFKMKVPIKEIKPFSIQYAVDYPENKIPTGIIFLDQIQQYGILTYQKEGKFIMSDDYATYLALRVEGYKEITIINLGKINNCPYEVIEVGGKELIPPLIYTHEELGFDNKTLDSLLDEKIEVIQKLRKIKKILFDDFKDVREAIKEDELKRALNLLEEITIDKDDLTEIIAIEARLNKLNSDSRLGILKYDDEVIEFNRIRINLLRLIDKI